MDDRPTQPEGNDDEGFKLISADDSPPSASGPVDDASADESSGGEGRVDQAAGDDSGDDPDEATVRRPFRARDLLDDPAPDEFGSVPAVDPDQSPADSESPAGSATLPPWTDPPTGEVPRIFSSGDDD